MYRKRDLIPLFSVAFLQPFVFLLIPSASIFFTSTQFQHFSLKEYGALFLPTFASGALFSWLAGKWGQIKGLYSLFVIGIFANLLGLFLLGATILTTDLPTLSYAFFLFALFALGAGFGCLYTLVVTTTHALFAHKKDIATVCVFVLTGSAAFVAPAFLKWAIHTNAIWVLNLALGIAFIILFVLGDFIGTFAHIEKPAVPKEPYPERSYLFFFSLLFLGVFDSIIVNWGPFYFSEQNVSQESLEYNLTLIGAGAILGRLFFAALLTKISARWILTTVPLAITILGLAIVSLKTLASILIIYAIVGFIQSILFPLIFSVAARSYPERSIQVTGRSFAGLWIGWGCGSFLFSYLNALGVPLSLLFPLTLSLSAFLIFIFNASALFYAQQ